MFRKIINTTDDIGPTILRLFLGVVMFPHGAQKMLGWYGGGGFTATMDFFVKGGIPAPLAFLVIVAEFFGSLGLIVGLLGRIAAFGIFCIMIVAVLWIHIHVGFFMNWAGTLKGEGFEYHLLAIAMCLVIMIKGSGAFSIDRLLTKRTSSDSGRS